MTSTCRVKKRCVHVCTSKTCACSRYSKTEGTPLTAAHFGKVRKLAESLSVAKGNKVDTVVDESRDRRDYGGLLTTAGGPGRDEHTGELAVERTGSPELAGRVPEGLPLAGEGAVTGGDTEEERVKLDEVGGIEDGVAGLGGRVELGKDVLRESLCDLVDGCRATGGLDTLLLGLSDWMEYQHW